MNHYNTFISNAHPQTIEGMYNDFKKNPNSIDPELKKFFEGFDYASDIPIAKKENLQINSDELKVYQLINYYRNYSHLLSDTNPIKKRKNRGASVNLDSFGLTTIDLEKKYSISKEIGLTNATLSNIIEKLNSIYISKIGFEISQVRNEEEKKWLLNNIENKHEENKFDIEKQLFILNGLNKSVVFEEFLGKKYIGEKRFSLEGGETTIPAIESMISMAINQDIKEVVIGMAHRGRLNVLANIMNKSYEEIFDEFEGIKIDNLAGDSDVKYHKGYTSLRSTDKGNIYINLLSNPSHLEAINPLVLGYCRAKSDILYSEDYSKVLPIIIHGDAAISGQGINQEIAQMSNLKGFRNFGTIHFVINNQIGFTTDFEDSRSSDYCTAIASITNSPVFHVNGDSVEDVIYVTELAMKYRLHFKKDVYIDMVCYRKHGHNESDDPKYTQPEMYKLISNKKNSRDIYTEYLTSKGTLESEMIKKMDKELYESLQDKLNKVKEESSKYEYRDHEKAWKKLIKARSEDFNSSPNTSISKDVFDTIANTITTIPKEFTPLSKIVKQIADWKQKMTVNNTIDWQAGELLAYGSLLMEGRDIRFTGEDVKRGTFSHRHCNIIDQNTNEEYCRLSNLSNAQGKMRIYNSLLSEYGVLGYEFGYSLASTENLVIWEAQFGDFTNGAQIIIDQFLMSSETKWKLNSAMVLLLPHGYEGQGPEHSSARLERFLQQCAEFNVQVCNITTPANYFHAIRRQLNRNFRIPLIIMSPKSLLRHPKCISEVKDITSGKFQELIDDNLISKDKVRKVLYCSGKIYYDLIAKREELKINDVAIVRLEQLYPIPINQLEQTFEKYKNIPKYWIQEEPANMGAWTYLLDRQYRMKGEILFKLIARKTSSSPATGNKKQHYDELNSLFTKAFE